MSTTVVLHDSSTYPKQAHSKVRERRQRQSRLHNAVSNAFSALTMLHELQRAQGDEYMQSSGQCVEQLKKTETDLFSELPDRVKQSPAREPRMSDGTVVKPPTAAALVKSANPDYEDKLRHRAKAPAPFEIALTPLPLAWDYTHAKSKIVGSSTLSGLFSKPGEGPVPAIKAPEGASAKDVVAKRLADRVKGMIEPKKGPKYVDPVASKPASPPRQVPRDFVPSCGKVDPTTLHTYRPKSVVTVTKGMKFSPTRGQKS